jgi:hypothetical protein
MIGVLDLHYRHMPGKYSEMLSLPPPEPLNSLQRDFNLRSMAPKNKKGLNFVAHLRIFLELDAVADWVSKQDGLLRQIGQFTDLFIGMQPQAHETEHHVSYEIDWYKPFNFLAHFAILIKSLGECYQRAQPNDIFSAMRFTSDRILNDLCLRTDVLDPEKHPAPKSKKVKIAYSDGSSYPAGQSLILLDQQLHGVSGFSFHHYNHFFMAQLIDSLARSIIHHGHTMDFVDALNLAIVAEEDTYEEWWTHQRMRSTAGCEEAWMRTLLLIDQPLSSKFYAFIRMKGLISFKNTSFSAIFVPTDGGVMVPVSVISSMPMSMYRDEKSLRIKNSIYFKPHRSCWDQRISFW